MSTNIQRGMGRVQFLANLESIRTEINAGFPMNAVFAKHQEKLDITYSQFARYVKKYIKENAAAPKAFVSKPATVSHASSQDSPDDLAKKLEKLNNPAPLPDEDLF